jgi:hypothetical protein
MLQFMNDSSPRDGFHAVPIHEVEECRPLMLRYGCNRHRQWVRLSALWQQVEVLKLSRGCCIFGKIYNVSTAERPQTG